MTTRCAGRLTPCASVEVVQSTWTSPRRNSSSINVRSLSSSPAVCMPTPCITQSANPLFLNLRAAACSLAPCCMSVMKQERPRALAPLATSCAAFKHSLRVAQNTSEGRPDECSRITSNSLKLRICEKWNADFAGGYALMTTSNGTGRYSGPK